MSKCIHTFMNDTRLTQVTISGMDGLTYVNGDGVINGQDVARLEKYLANYGYETNTSTIVIGPNDKEEIW